MMVWDFVQGIDKDISFIANYFGFNIDYLKKCYCVNAVLSSVWSVKDNMDPSLWLNLVTKMKAQLFSFS